MAAAASAAEGAAAARAALRKVRWTRQDRVERWTTIRDIQKHVHKLLFLHFETNPANRSDVVRQRDRWERQHRNCDAASSYVARYDPLIFSSPTNGATAGVGTAMPPCALFPRVSAAAAGQIAIGVSLWLRSLQDVHDTFARNKKPYAETHRKGFYLFASVFPTRGVERRSTPSLTGRVSIVNNEIGEQRPLTEKGAGGIDDIYVSLPLTAMPGDMAVASAAMQTVASILSSLYIRDRVACCTTNSPLLAHIVETLMPHLIEKEFVSIHVTPEASTLEQEEARRYLTYRDLGHTWVLLPSANARGGWNSKAIRRVARYFSECDANLVYFDEGWPHRAEFEDAMQQLRRAAIEATGKSSGAPQVSFDPRVVAVPDLYSSLGTVLQTGLVSFFGPEDAISDVRMTRAAAKGLQNTRVVGFNCSATDALFAMPHLQLDQAGKVGNCFRFKDVEKSYVQKPWLSRQMFSGLGGGIPLLDRVECQMGGAPLTSSVKSSDRGAYLLLQERQLEYLRNPHITTLLPVLTSRYLSL